MAAVIAVLQETLIDEKETTIDGLIEATKPTEDPHDSIKAQDNHTPLPSPAAHPPTATTEEEISEPTNMLHTAPEEVATVTISVLCETWTIQPSKTKLGLKKISTEKPKKLEADPPAKFKRGEKVMR